MTNAKIPKSFKNKVILGVDEGFGGIVMKTIIWIGAVILLLISSACVKSGQSTVKVGLIGPLTGDVAVYGVPVSQAAKLAVDQINGKGGINGRQVALITEDSRCDAGAANTAMQKLATQDKVVGIIGGLCSSETLAAAPIAEQTKVPIISPASTSPDITLAGDYVFRVVASDSFQGKIGANLAASKGFRKAAVLYINNDYGVGLKSVFSETFRKKGGEIVLEDAFAPSESSFQTLLTKAKGRDPDVYVVSLAVEAGQILRQKGELGLNIPFILSEGSKDDSVIAAAGAGAEGVYVTFPKPNTDSAVYQGFAAAYKTATGEEAKIYTSESYDAANMLLQAIQKSDGTGEGIKNSLYSLGAYEGASGTIEFDQFGDTSKPYTVMVIENGKFVQHDELMS